MRFTVNRPYFNEPDEILSAYPVLKEYEPQIDFPYKKQKGAAINCGNYRFGEISGSY